MLLCVGKSQNLHLCTSMISFSDDIYKDESHLNEVFYWRTTDRERENGGWVVK